MWTRRPFPGRAALISIAGRPLEEPSANRSPPPKLLAKNGPQPKSVARKSSRWRLRSVTHLCCLSCASSAWRGVLPPVVGSGCLPWASAVRGGRPLSVAGCCCLSWACCCCCCCCCWLLAAAAAAVGGGVPRNHGNKCATKKGLRRACSSRMGGGLPRIKPIHGESRGLKVKHVQNLKRTLREPTQNTYGSVKIVQPQYASLITTHCSNTRAITSHRSVLVFSGPRWLAGWLAGKKKQSSALRAKTSIAVFQISGIIISPNGAAFRHGVVSAL